MSIIETPKYVSAEGLLEILEKEKIFPPEAFSLRKLKEWGRTRRIPSMKLGATRLYEPEAVLEHLKQTRTVKGRPVR